MMPRDKSINSFNETSKGAKGVSDRLGVHEDGSSPDRAIKLPLPSKPRYEFTSGCEGLNSVIAFEE